MKKSLAVGLLVVGVALLVLGFEANRSLSSDVSRLFTGAATNKAVYLLAGGALAFVIGLAGLA